MYSSPLGKHWRRKKVEEDVPKPLEKFKKGKPIISGKTGKDLVQRTVSTQEMMWIDGWLENLVGSRSLPPQCKGKDAFSAIMQFLAPQDALSVLESIRKDFVASHPKEQPPSEDYAFLLAELVAYPAHQNPPPLSDHNSLTHTDDLSHSEEDDTQ